MSDAPTKTCSGCGIAKPIVAFSRDNRRRGERPARSGQGVEFQLPSLKDAVVDTVQKPTAIYQSNTRPEDSFVFLKSDTTNAGGDPLRVPVKIDSANTASGFVSTAYFSASTSHGKLIWERTDD